MNKELLLEIIAQLESNIRVLETAAFKIDGAIIEDVSENVVESTSCSTTCIIELRHSKNLLDKLKHS